MVIKLNYWFITVILIIFIKAQVHVEHMKETEHDHHDKAVDNFIRGSSQKLTEYLLSNHNRNAPPDGVINIHFELELVHILGIDELKQTMTALVYVEEIWEDPSLAWNPEEFGGLTKTWLPMHKIWRPDLIVFNMVSSYRLHHEDLLSSVRAPVTIYYNGTVESSNPAVYTVSCEINIKMFPLDDQKCAMEIASWAYSDEKIRLHSNTEHSLDHYSPNEEWHLMGVEVKEMRYIHEGVPVSEIHYEISVKRKPLFYMVTLTFPSYVMCATSIVGLFARFSTTGEREERFTLGVSGILTMAVLSLVVSEKVPHSSTSVPLLVSYFLYNMVTVSVASMFTGIVMRIHRKGRYGDEPPEWLLRLVLLKPHGEQLINGFNLKNDNNNHHQKKNCLINNSTMNQSTHSDCNTYHYVKGSIIQNTVPGQVSFEITEDFKREKGNSQHHEPTIVKKLLNLENMITKLLNLTSSNTVAETSSIKKQDSFEQRTENRKRKQENNGWVRLSERLDVIFMTFFLFAVTIPVAYLFICMWAWSEDY